MTATRKIVIGLGLAGGAVLAAWLLTGDRKKKTKDFVVRKAQDFKQSIRKDKENLDDPESYYYL
jgi:multisubunit Na+/H+ antiporter MnhC subunit